MRVVESCAQCLFDKQEALSKDPAYLKEIKRIIDSRGEEDTAPYLVYIFNKTYESYFGKKASYKKIKKEYNDLVLSMEDELKRKIKDSPDPLVTALLYARIGNYIDFGAMKTVDKDTFLSFFDQVSFSEQDQSTIRSFLGQCAKSESFLLLSDNCGEIVLDKLFIQELKERFPRLQATVMVRGEEVLNDATLEDARYIKLDECAKVITNGYAVAGTIYKMLPSEAKEVFDKSDLILSKGQGNYETLCGYGYHIFYSFLCKCELFTNRFKVPKFTGIFLEENQP